MLQAVNRKAVQGVLYNGDTTLRQELADLLGNLSESGAIS
jgi:hypothetical protein